MNGLTIDLRTTSDTPIYQQIAERIRAAILDGSLESDACLPPIRTMAAELRVSVITVKKAYELLERQGLLYAVTGRGSFVAPIAAGDRGGRRTELAEEQLKKDLARYKALGVTKAELLMMVERLYGE